MWLSLALFAIFVSSGALAQQPRARQERVHDPVTTVMKGTLRSQGNNLVWAAELMPAEKYGFAPNAQQQHFGQLLVQIVESNNTLCGIAGAVPPPKVDDLNGKTEKTKLLRALKASFEFCETAFTKMHDSSLGDTVPFTPEMLAPRALALFALTEEWADKYRELSIYLSLNGIIPPNAAGRDQ